MSLMKKTIRSLIYSVGVAGLILFLAACPKQKSDDAGQAPEQGMEGMDGMQAPAGEGMQGMEGMAGESN